METENPPKKLQVHFDENRLGKVEQALEDKLRDKMRNTRHGKTVMVHAGINIARTAYHGDWTQQEPVSSTCIIKRVKR